MSKLKDGRDEPILDPDTPIIDSHHHLFDRPPLRYMFEDYREDAAAGHKIVATVYVETLAMARCEGPEALRPIGEIEFANGVAAMSASGGYGPCRVAAAIVGYADLRLGEQVAITLDRSLAAAPDRYRGVRQIAMDHPDPAILRFLTNKPPKGLLQHPKFREGFSQLAQRGLSFDAAVLHHQMPEIEDLAMAYPQTAIVLNHMGLATATGLDAGGRAEVFRDWREKLRSLGRHPNVFCKIGGLGTTYWGFGFNETAEPTGYLALSEAWRPYVETAIEVFGAGRCMTESNYPADGRSCGFVPVWNALKHIVSGCSSDEKAALFYGTAAAVYRIPGP